jgi:hypothetical protein
LLLRSKQSGAERSVDRLLGVRRGELAQYWGLEAIGKAVGLRTGAAVMTWYWERNLPMLLRRNGSNNKKKWWTCDIMLAPWLLAEVRQNKKEVLAMRESRARVRASNGKADPKRSSPPPDVVASPPPPDAPDAK